MFKKRTRPASVRDKPEHQPDEPVASGSNTPEEGTEDAQSIDDLILLRKLRKARQGIDLERFNRGEASAKVEREDAAVRFGLQSVKGKGKADDRDREPLDEDEKERVKRMVRSNNFTQQTNALDVDKHMMAYIEEELSKRKGNTIREGEQAEKPFDPQDELFQIVEKYKLDTKVVKETEEGSVTNSLGMLTSIPEVDLGMENRLRNIEATEKAKREMMEARQAAQGRPAKKQDPAAEDYAATRFQQQRLKIASDGYAAEEAKREAAGLLPPGYDKPKLPRVHEPRSESATDEQVYDRFKKRMKR